MSITSYSHSHMYLPIDYMGFLSNYSIYFIGI